MSDDQLDAIKQMAKEMYGDVHATELPAAYADEQLRKKAGVPYHIWHDDDHYDYSIRGKLAAIEIVENQLQTVERFYEIMKRNKDKAERDAKQQQQQQASNQRRARPRPKPPRRTNAYRRRLRRK